MDAIYMYIDCVYWCIDGVYGCYIESE